MSVAPIIRQLLAAALLVPFVAGSLLVLLAIVRIALTPRRFKP